MLFWLQRAGAQESCYSGCRGVGANKQQIQWLDCAPGKIKRMEQKFRSRTDQWKNHSHTILGLSIRWLTVRHWVLQVRPHKTLLKIDLCRGKPSKAIKQQTKLTNQAGTWKPKPLYATVTEMTANAFSTQV